MVVPKKMMAIVTTGNGGYEKLDFREVPVPALANGDVLIKVLAAGVNNTEINTRLGWYSASVVSATQSLADLQNLDVEQKADGGWNKATPFPIIQGTDCCGLVVAAGNQKDNCLLGKRVIVRPCMRLKGWDNLEHAWMASDFDGAFAEYVKVPATEVFVVDCEWSDTELASVPCAYGTSENMLHRAAVGQGQRVLVTGASGGVGSATVQLAKRRGASVIAVTTEAKAHHLKALGVDQIVYRGQDLVAVLGEECLDVVVDNVAGDDFGQFLKLLKRGGLYVSSGAIAGPIVKMDLRDMYLKDIRLIGCTAWDEPVFANLIRYIERGEIKPMVARTFRLADIAQAQQEFLNKEFVGKFVLLP